MDLRDRRRPDRNRIEVAVQRLQRHFEGELDFLADALERHRRQRVLQCQQVARGFLADQVGARRERLAELDRRGADRLEGGGIIGHRGLRRPEAREPAQPFDADRGRRRALDPAQRPVAREDAAPFQQAGNMDDRTGQAFHPLWIATNPPMIGSTFTAVKPAAPIILANSGIGGKRRIDSIR